MITAHANRPGLRVPGAEALPEGCVPACPGCHHRHLPAAASAARKQRWLERVLAPWAGRIRPLRSGGPRLGYRDKVSLSTRCIGGRWHIGLWRRDELIDIPRCPVHSARVNALADWVRLVVPTQPQWPLAFLAVSGAQATLVFKSARLPPPDWFNDAARVGLAAVGIEGLWINKHPCAGLHLFAKRGWEHWWGAAQSWDDEGLRYGPGSFHQLIAPLAREALDVAEDFLRPRAGDAVIDLYCGRGGSLRRWLAAGSAVIGVEAGGDAVDSCRDAMPQATVLQGHCAQRLPQLRQWLAAHGDARLAYLNPPRTGVEPEVIRWLSAEARPERLAYLSCSAGTLARDLVLLEHAGYGVTAVQPFDFFPQTHHVETLALLAAGECSTSGTGIGPSP